MSNRQSKRGFVRPQHSASLVGPNAVRSAWHREAWRNALRDYEAAEGLLESTCAELGIYRGVNAPIPTDVRDAYAAARDKLISTPAPDGEALAYKLAVVVRAFTGLEGDLRKHKDRAWVAQHGDDGDKAALALYLDALTMSGVPAAPYDPDASEVVAGYAAVRSWDWEDDNEAQRCLADTEEALITTRARSLGNIAFKLHAAWSGTVPDHDTLDETTVGAILKDQSIGNEHRLIASAFLDLRLLAAEQRELEGR